MVERSRLRLAEYRERFKKRSAGWVHLGVDEEIAKARGVRGRARERGPSTGGRKRGDNTPVDRRYEWTAKRQLGVPLKEIAAQDNASRRRWAGLCEQFSELRTGRFDRDENGDNRSA